MNDDCHPVFVLSLSDIAGLDAERLLIGGWQIEKWQSARTSESACVVMREWQNL